MKKMTKLMVLAAVAAMAMLVMTGCMRKHISSSPPAQRPGAKAATTPAPTPKIVEEKPEIIEETYVVDSPADDGEPAVIREGELAEEEPVVVAEAEPKKTAAAAVAAEETAEKKAEAATEEVIAKETPAEKKAIDETVTKAEQEPAQPVLGEMYYVQVGAFSDLENANKVLARLLSDGYKGSRLSKTDDGLFRVQAGAFTDEESATAVLGSLKAEFPKGFVLKEAVSK